MAAELHDMYCVQGLTVDAVAQAVSYLVPLDAADCNGIRILSCQDDSLQAQKIVRQHLASQGDRESGISTAGKRSRPTESRATSLERALRPLIAVCSKSKQRRA